MKKHILMIDDNPDDLEFYSDLLKKSNQNYELHTAESSNEAIILFEKYNIYCTFIDYYLPENNGIKILEALKERAQGRVLAVVILTGEPNQKIQVEAARSGALDYIIKDIANTAEQIEAVILKTTTWANDLNEKQTDRLSPI